MPRMRRAPHSRGAPRLLTYGPELLSFLPPRLTRAVPRPQTRRPFPPPPPGAGSTCRRTTWATRRCSTPSSPPPQGNPPPPVSATPAQHTHRATHPPFQRPPPATRPPLPPNRPPSSHPTPATVSLPRPRPTQKHVPCASTRPGPVRRGRGEGGGAGRGGGRGGGRERPGGDGGWRVGDTELEKLYSSRTMNTARTMNTGQGGDAVRGYIQSIFSWSWMAGQGAVAVRGG